MQQHRLLDNKRILLGVALPITAVSPLLAEGLHMLATTSPILSRYLSGVLCMAVLWFFTLWFSERRQNMEDLRLLYTEMKAERDRCHLEREKIVTGLIQIRKDGVPDR